MQGLKASLLGAIPYSAVRLGSYDGLKWTYKRVSLSRCCLMLLFTPTLKSWKQGVAQHMRAEAVVALMQRTGKESVPPHMTMIFGAIAAVASSSASFPLEIVRRRAMMGTLPVGSGALHGHVPTDMRSDWPDWHARTCCVSQEPASALSILQICQHML